MLNLDKKDYLEFFRFTLHYYWYAVHTMTDGIPTIKISLEVLHHFIYMVTKLTSSFLEIVNR